MKFARISFSIFSFPTFQIGKSLEAGDIFLSVWKQCLHLILFGLTMLVDSSSTTRTDPARTSLLQFSFPSSCLYKVSLLLRSRAEIFPFLLMWTQAFDLSGRQPIDVWFKKIDTLRAIFTFSNKKTRRFSK